MRRPSPKPWGYIARQARHKRSRARSDAAAQKTATPPPHGDAREPAGRGRAWGLVLAGVVCLVPALLRVFGIIKEELRVIQEKYATARRTDLVPDEGEIAIEDLIANEGVIITITHNGLIKRTNVSSYRAQRRGGKPGTRYARGRHK